MRAPALLRLLPAVALAAALPAGCALPAAFEAAASAPPAPARRTLFEEVGMEPAPPPKAPPRPAAASRPAPRPPRPAPRLAPARPVRPVRDALHAPTLAVVVDRAGGYFVENRPLSSAALAARLERAAAEAPSTVVLLRPAAGAPAAAIRRVEEIGDRTGLHVLSFPAR